MSPSYRTPQRTSVRMCSDVATFANIDPGEPPHSLREVYLGRGPVLHPPAAAESTAESEAGTEQVAILEPEEEELGFIGEGWRLIGRATPGDLRQCRHRR